MTASKGQRARRSDAGIVRPTRRDAVALRWLGEQFGAPLPVFAQLYGVGERAARQNAERLERAGFASRLTVSGRQWVVPTRAGLWFAGLDYGVWRPREWKLEHVEGTGRLRLWLQEEYPDAVWTSERAIRSRWANTGARVRYADGQVDLEDGRCVGIELEVHRKKRHEYEGIAGDVDPEFDEVWWFCPATDVTWLADVLDGIPKPERPAHHVLRLPEGVTR
jgi:hypothetical protein